MKAGPQTPYYSSTQLIYFATPELQDGSHTINITVTGADITNLYILDYITISPTPGGSSSGVMTTTMAPPPPSITPTSDTTHSTPLGAIAGGIVGGIAILVAAVYYFMSRRNRSRHQQPYYFEKPSTENILASEGPCIFHSLSPGDAEDLS